MKRPIGFPVAGSFLFRVREPRKSHNLTERCSTPSSLTSWMKNQLFRKGLSIIHILINVSDIK